MKPAATASAQAPSPPDPAKLLEQLDKLEDTVKKARAGHNLATVDTIRDAATSDQKAVSLWIDCVHEADFRDKEKKESEFREWRAGAGKKLSDPTAAAALRFHLQYLVLTIRAGGVKTDAERGELLSSVLSFLDELTKADQEVLKQRQILEMSVLGTPVARRFKLDVTVKPAIEWVLTPLDVVGIYETSVLPLLREKKDPAKLQAAWNRRIQHEGALAAAPGSEFILKTFREITLPALEWGQARDLLRAGHAPSAAKLLQIIQQNQTHKDVPAWITELKAMLTEKVDAGAATAGVANATIPPELPPADVTKPPEAPATVPPEPPPADDADSGAAPAPRELPKPPNPGFPPNLRR
jgi:hypothetical protein